MICTNSEYTHRSMCSTETFPVSEVYLSIYISIKNVYIYLSTPS